MGCDERPAHKRLMDWPRKKRRTDASQSFVRISIGGGIRWGSGRRAASQMLVSERKIVVSFVGARLRFILIAFRGQRSITSILLYFCKLQAFS
jgi:hypothetical protein